MFMFMFMGFLYLFVTVTADDYNVFSKIFYDKFLPSSIHDKNIKSNLYFIPPEKSQKQTKKCDSLYETYGSNYVVMLLYKTSGRFMGMGAIIDKKTVITAMDAIKFAYRTPQDIQITAGYFSPWWGRNAQVRNCANWVANDYELVLAEVYPSWKFGGSVNAIELKKLSQTPLSAYADDFFIYGIRTGSSINSGDFMPKGSTYIPALHTPTKAEECEKDYDIKSFNSTVHLCFSPNETFCWGCIGSPVVGIRKASYGMEMKGVVIRSTCGHTAFKVVAVNAPFFETWIIHHSV